MDRQGNGETIANRHVPVLLKEVLELVRPSRTDGWFVDATVGLGGHTEALLESDPKLRVLGIDRDEQALGIAKQRLARFGERIRLTAGRYESLIEILEKEQIGSASGVLADLGVSSMQLDDPSRGFSFRLEGPLDMRMGSTGATAADLVNELSEEELADVLRRGEEPMARRIARAIVQARLETRITTTTELANIVRKAKGGRGDKIDPATLTFQALRIATNEELAGLDRFIDEATDCLEEGGRLGVIAFHSLEDRIVKRALRRLAGECTCPPGLPVCGCGARGVLRTITRHAVEASEEEKQRNPRARSAKLRVGEKTDQERNTD